MDTGNISYFRNTIYVTVSVDAMRKGKKQDVLGSYHWSVNWLITNQCEIPWQKIKNVLIQQSLFGENIWRGSKNLIVRFFQFHSFRHWQLVGKISLLETIKVANTEHALCYFSLEINASPDARTTER